MALGGHEVAWPALQVGGAAVDAVEQVCRVTEDDPSVDSVGFGGLPDQEGNVTVDGCIMCSPQRMGGVAAMMRHRHAVTVARQVMDKSKHVLLVGEAADDFADQHGIPSTPMCSDHARMAWQQWRQDGTMPPQGIDRSLDGHGLPGSEGEVECSHDTIGTLALDVDGHLAGACSTSGLCFKTPGRVGDSPIIGHGLYVEPGVGAATATGVGELISAVCGSFLAVEALREGLHPAQAAGRVIDRINAVGSPAADDQVAVVVLAADGRVGAAARVPGFRLLVSTASGHTCLMPDRGECQSP